MLVLTGATGLLGKYFLDNWESTHITVCISRKVQPHNSNSKNIKWEFGELSDPVFMKKIFTKYRPQTIIHAGGEGGVDLVEKDPTVGELGIKKISKIITDLSNEYDSNLIYVSSNAVFGNTKKPLSDKESYSPINKYGEYKMEAEKYIKGHKQNYVIVRPIVMYGVNNPMQRNNPLTNWIQKLSKGEKIRVVDDVYTQPLYAEICAKSIIRAVELQFNGSFNVSGGQTITLYDFALKIARIFEYPTSLIEPIKSSELEGLAPRPMQTEYLMEACKDVFKLDIPSIEENLQRIKESMF